MPHRELAHAYLTRDDVDAAERALEAALAGKSTPEDLVMTYNTLGNLCLRRGRLDEAAEAFEAGLKLYRHPHLLSGLGRLAIQRAQQANAHGDRSEAVRQVWRAYEILQEAVALDPRDYKSHVMLGQVLFNLGRSDEARVHLQTALSIESHGAIADVARRYLAKLGS
jgi:tetratricopeptide (TPR) repeat protein